MAERWKQVHERLVALAQSKAQYDREEARWLVQGLRAKVHVRLGYGSYLEYLERIFGYERRLGAERLRVAEALEELPVLAHALEQERVCWSVVRELTRVATPDTEAEWLEAAQGRTVREVERMVAGRKRGGRPTDRPDPGARPHVVRYEVRAETLAMLREAQRKLTRDAGCHLDDDELVRLMAQQVLGGPKDEGRSGYQIAVTVCSDCRRGWQQGGDEALEIDAETIERATCDAQHIGDVDDRAAHADTHVGAGAAVETHSGAANAQPHVGANRRPEDRANTADPGAHVGASRRSNTRTQTDDAQPHLGTGGPSKTHTDDAGADSKADESHVGARSNADVDAKSHVGARSNTDPKSHVGTGSNTDAKSRAEPKARASGTKRRASQTIPPAIRRQIVRRDGGRCIVPGCRNRCHLEVHHFDPRSEGGEHDPDRMALLCSTHHRAVHRGFLIIKGRISEGLDIRHADGTRYGLSARPEATDTHAKAFQALRQMGFREPEARNAVDAARSQLGTHVGLEQVLRAALRAAPTTRAQPGVRESVATYWPAVA